MLVDDGGIGRVGMKHREPQKSKMSSGTAKIDFDESLLSQRCGGSDAFPSIPLTNNNKHETMARYLSRVLLTCTNDDRAPTSQSSLFHRVRPEDYNK